MSHDVAVIGLGYFSRFHLEAWQRIDGARLIAAADPDAAKREQAATDYGIDVFESAEALLARHASDIVDIVAPPTAHLGLVRTALAEGRTIICQKPFGQSVEEADVMVRLAEKAGSRLVIHENFRFQPWYRTIKARLHDGLLGTVYQARFALRPGDGRGENAYLERQPAFQKMPRLLIHETGVHFIDLFRWMFGPAKAVYADLRRFNQVIAGEDAGVLMLDHFSGAGSTFDGNRLADHSATNRRHTMGEMEIEGENGTLRIDGEGSITFRAFQANDWQPIAIDHPVDPDAFGGGCVEALNRHVIAALNGRASLENEARDYLPVWDIVNAAYRSAREGRKVYLG